MTYLHILRMTTNAPMHQGMCPYDHIAFPPMPRPIYVFIRRTHLSIKCRWSGYTQRANARHPTTTTIIIAPTQLRTKRLSQPAQAAESYNQSVTYYVINGNAIYFIGFDVEFFGITFFSFALGVSAVSRWCGIDAEGQEAREIYFIYRQRSMGCGPCFSKCLNGQSVLRATQHLQLLYKWFLWCIILHVLLCVVVCVLCVSYLFFLLFYFRQINSFM